MEPTVRALVPLLAVPMHSRPETLRGGDLARPRHGRSPGTNAGQVGCRMGRRGKAIVPPVADGSGEMGCKRNGLQVTLRTRKTCRA
jgi:hypothetical protein